MSELTSKEVAERIGVSMSTLKNWAVRLPVPSSLGPDGTRQFPPEALEVLEAVKHLREEQRSYETIRRTIAPVPDLVELDVAQEAPPAELESHSAPEAASALEAPSAPESASALESPPSPESAAALESPDSPLALASLSAPDSPPRSDAASQPDAEFQARLGPQAPSELVLAETPFSEASLEPALTAMSADAAPPELAVVMARVLEVLGEQNALSESYASSRQRVGELEMALKVAHDDRVRLQAELAETRRQLDLRELSAARKRPWWTRFFDLD